jgi:hypothetical protein
VTEGHTLTQAPRAPLGILGRTAIMRWKSFADLLVLNVGRKGGENVMSNLISSKKKNKAFQFFFAAAAILLLLVQALPQSAGSRQVARPTVNTQTKAVKIDPSIYRVNARPPIAFKPLDMIEPRTGKPVGPNELIKLENGKTLTAAKYYEQMNKLEAEFNKMGHSFRDTEKKVNLNETIVDRAKINQQIRNVRTVAGNPGTAAKIAAIAQAHRSYVSSVRASVSQPNGRPGPTGGYTVVQGLFAKTMSSENASRPSMPIVIPGAGASGVAPPKIRPSLRIGTFSKGPDNQPIFGDPRIGILTASPTVTFYVHKTDGLAKKYAWQVVRANANGDNFGTERQGQYNDVGPDGWKTWKSVYGAVNGTTTVTAQSGGDPNWPYFFIDFRPFTQDIPAGQSWAYLVRIIPMNDDGSLAGYPSFPMRVTYGQNPTPTPFAPPPTPPAGPLPVLKPGSVSMPPWTYHVGDPKTISIDLTETMQKNQDPVSSTDSFDFTAGFHLLGIPITLLDASASTSITMSQGADSYNVSSPGTVSGKASLQILGIEQCSDCTQSAPDRIWIGKDFSLPYDLPYTASFNIGPIDISATVGLSVNLVFGFHVSAEVPAPFTTVPGLGGTGIGKINTGQISAPVALSVGPSVTAKAYLRGAVGIGLGGFDVVDVGAQGDVDLLDFGLALSMGGDKYSGVISQFQVLNGHFFAFAKAGICPFFCKEWDWHIFDWDGADVLANDPNHGLLFEGQL